MCRAGESDQHAVWRDVEAKSQALRVESPTMSMPDLYDGRAGELDGYAAAFRAEPGQRGALAAGGRVVHLAGSAV